LKERRYIRKTEPVVKEGKGKKQEGGESHRVDNHDIFVDTIIGGKFDYHHATTLS